MKITTKKSTKSTKKDQNPIEKVKKLKDSLLEIDLKELDWQDTSNPQTKYYGTRLDLEGLKVRVQIFIK